MVEKVTYAEIIEEEALDFITEHNHREALVQLILDESDFDPSDRGIDRIWTEHFDGRDFDREDAEFIVENSLNEETDSGLWEGQGETEALQTKAWYTFKNDVAEKVQEIYDEIKETVETAVSDHNIEDNPDDVAHKGGVAKRMLSNGEKDIHLDAVFNQDGGFVGLSIFNGTLSSFVRAESAEWKQQIHDRTDVPEEVLEVAEVIVKEGGEPSYSDMTEAFAKVVAAREFDGAKASRAPELIERGSEEERVAIRDYMRAARNTSRGRYPLGQAYVDTRVGALYGTDEFDITWANRKLARQLPHLRGSSPSDLKRYYDETFGGPTPTNAEEMLAKIEFMIRDGATNQELYDVLPEIRAIRAAEQGRGMSL